MAKDRKTRKQKQISDVRKTQPVALSPNQQPGTYTYTFQSPKLSITNVPRTVSSSDHSYQFIITDLRKTFLTTLAIIAAQVVLFFVLKK